MNKIYTIFLENKQIGTTQLEKGDALLGIAFGVIKFVDSKIGYDFIKEYCEKRQVDLAVDNPNDKLISTRTIDTLSIINDKGIEIKGEMNQITGMDGDEYDIVIEGIPYPLYENEFPHHVKAYEDTLNDENKE